MDYKEAIKGLDWWHTIELPDGTVTPGKVDYRDPEKARRFQLPKDLTGKRVLDLGTFDGYWAIEAKKRGADVTAADRWMPSIPTVKIALDAYDIPYYCTTNLDSTAINFPSPNILAYDLVLYYGILYHQKNPWGGLKYCYDRLKDGGTLLLETAVNQGKMKEFKDSDVPLLWLIDEVHHNDPSNYVMPNEAGIIQLAKMAGFERYGDIIYDEPRARVGMTFRKV